MPDLEVVWSGALSRAGVLLGGPWPPQRPDAWMFTAPPERPRPADPTPLRGQGSAILVCAGCGVRVRCRAKRLRHGQRYCSPRCYHRHARRPPRGA